MTGYVVDASVAVKWLIAEPFSDLAARLLKDDAVLAAPQLIYAEVTNALWAANRRGDISAAGLREAVDVLADVPLLVPTSMKQLMPAALRLAGDLDHPAYDCMYLALAVQEERPVITADRRFYDVGERHPYLSGRVIALQSFEA